MAYTHPGRSRGSPGRLLLDWSPLLLESIPTNGVTLGGIHGMVASASPVLPRRDRGRAGSPGRGGWIEQLS